jgi:hypothetical protein
MGVNIMATNQGIHTGELPLIEVSRVDVFRHGDGLLLLLDGNAYAIPARPAAELALQLWGQTETITLASQPA